MTLRPTDIVLWLTSGWAVLGIVAGWTLLSESRQQHDAMVFLGVGQGQSVLLTTQGTNFLYDTGLYNRVEPALRDALAFWDKNIENISLSHFDRDHIEGTISLLQNWNIHTVRVSQALSESPVVDTLITTLAHKHITVTTVATGSIERRGNCWETTLQGDKSQTPHTTTETNEESLIFRLNCKGHQVLIAGDMPVQNMPKTSQTWSKQDIVLIPHHGSKHNISPEWLDTARPRLAIIQTGKNAY